ncbi:hypothetical protein [Methylobacterium oryzihabitans]|uniref:Uncharacterized protein n=1 Tax=Methylobacterium oryzihabitans TaxID=2499852 RepID=A0A437NWT7_9HYPH|nr:hypothetical protein [Methylobacterium oryzihabitans]RVU14391.1 hypothetical protein EOE48_23475 [Methylobacterium oryzihabitans]
MGFARLLIVVGLAAGAAQAREAADQTGTGGGPGSTITAPYTTSTGQTVPRPGAAERAGERRLDDLTREERRNDAIDDSICRGCR